MVTVGDEMGAEGRGHWGGQRAGLRLGAGAVV